MQSKKSYFNKSMFLKNITRCWPIWFLYTMYLVVTIPVNLYIRYNGGLADYTNQVDRNNAKLNYLESGLAWGTNALVLAVVAVLSAVTVFYYLYNSRSANMMHAFPMSRRELYITNYVSGMLNMVIPQFLTMLLTLFVCFVFEVPQIEYVVYGFFYMIGGCFTFFSIAVFGGMFTGQAVVVPVFFLVLNFLYVGIKYITYQLVMAVSFGMSQSLALKGNEILSPLYSMYLNEPVHTIYNSRAMEVALKAQGGKQILIYCIVAVLILFLSYVIYQRRALECAGDMVSICWAKPLLRWGAAFGFGELSAAMLYQVVQQYGNTVRFAVLLLCIILVGVGVFFGVEMLLEKKFRVFKKTRVLEAAVVALILFSGSMMLEHDAFGFETWTPEEDQVAEAYVSMYEPILGEEPEEISQIVDYQEKIIAHKETIEKQRQIEGASLSNVNFKYVMKDGSVAERHYYIYSSQDISSYSETPKDPIESILYAIYQDSFTLEHYMEAKFGKNYEDAEIISGQVDLYDPDKDYEYENRIIEKRQMERILEAVKQDVEEGAMRNLQAMFGGEVGVDSNYWYENSISVDYGISAGIDEISEKYYSVDGVVDENNKLTETNAYLLINRDCTHTIEALLAEGIIDNKDQLISWNEYENMIEE